MSFFFSSHRSCDREKRNEMKWKARRVVARNTFDTRLEMEILERGRRSLLIYSEPSEIGMSKSATCTEFRGASPLPLNPVSVPHGKRKSFSRFRSIVLKRSVYRRLTVSRCHFSRVQSSNTRDYLKTILYSRVTYLWIPYLLIGALPLAEAISLSKLIPSICRARIFLRCIYSVSVSVEKETRLTR